MYPERFSRSLSSSKQRPLLRGQAQENPEEGGLLQDELDEIVELDDEANVEINFSTSGASHLGHETSFSPCDPEKSSSKT